MPRRLLPAGRARHEVDTLRAVSSRVRLWLLLGPVIVAVIGSYVGAALHPTLVTENPVLLILLNPRNYHLTLVTQELAFAAFFAVGFIRLVTLDPLLYLLGYWYGPAGRRWLERQTEASTGILALLDKWFPKVSWLLVFAAPNTYVCLLAGLTRMRPVIFAVLNVCGTVARLLLIWWAAGAIEDQLQSVLDFFSRYQLPVTLAAVAIVAIQVGVSMRKQTGEINELRSLGHEMGDSDVETGDGPGAAEAGAIDGQPGGDEPAR